MEKCNDELVNSMWKMSDEIQKLRKENETLKKGNETFKDSIHKLLQVQYKLADNCKKYRKTLEEIQKVADRTDSQHPESVAHLVSVFRREISEVLEDESK